MDIEQLSKGKLLITLSSEDMKDFKVSFDSLSIENKQERKVLLRLLQLACAKSGVSCEDKTVFVEALPFEGGCALLVTLVNRERERKTDRVKRQEKFPVVKFSCAEDLLSAAKSLKGKAIYRNSLWLWEGEYFLIMDYPVLSRESSLILSQYGRILSLTPVARSRIRESGRALCKDDAMRLLGESM